MPTLAELIKKESPNDQEYLKRFILEEMGDIKVNWEAIGRYEKENTQADRLKIIDKAYSILMELGVLSTDPKGNYLLTDGDFVLNPVGSLFNSLYFTRLLDAKEYERAHYESEMTSTFMFLGVKESTSN
ncbi:hypothetical protein HYT23_04240 [Candidatus Pacearchaeota archaeon]|nr:hypothetical protein [Candidatus Pacearchaeota archaeon]